jgi:hypothetical protein
MFTVWVAKMHISKMPSTTGICIEVYPLVNVDKKRWKDPPCSMGKSTISMGIFNSYVKLPEVYPMRLFQWEKLMINHWLFFFSLHVSTKMRACNSDFLFSATTQQTVVLQLGGKNTPLL